MNALHTISNVMRRKRISASAIRSVVDQIAERFSPRRIILFGSYARGTPRPESDVDLLVVMPTKREGEQSLVIRQAIDCPFGLDLIVRTPQTLARRSTIHRARNYPTFSIRHFPYKAG